MAEFVIGDTVRLKSGGPLMTIGGQGNNNSGISDPNYWHCEWFDGSKANSRSFHKDSIEQDDDDLSGLNFG